MADLRVVRSENGFTVIELLTVVGVIAVLSANMVITSNEYRMLAYKAVQISQAHDLRASIEMGASDMDEKGWGLLNYGEDAGTAAYTGRIRDTTQNCWNPQLCVGFQAAKHVVAGASYDPACQQSGADGCTLYHVFVAHAKTCTIYNIVSQKNGAVVEFESPTSLCPSSSGGGGAGDAVDQIAATLPDEPVSDAAGAAGGDDTGGDEKPGDDGSGKDDPKAEGGK